MGVLIQAFSKKTSRGHILKSAGESSRVVDCGFEASRWGGGTTAASLSPCDEVRFDSLLNILNVPACRMRRSRIHGRNDGSDRSGYEGVRGCVLEPAHEPLPRLAVANVGVVFCNMREEHVSDVVALGRSMALCFSTPTVDRSKRREPTGIHDPCQKSTISMSCGQVMPCRALPASFSCGRYRYTAAMEVSN